MLWRPDMAGPQEMDMDAVVDDLDDMETYSSDGYEEGSPSEEMQAVIYSREATIAAFNDFYRFVTKTFLAEDYVDWPSEDGWPSITPERVAAVDLHPEVGHVLASIPYVDQLDDTNVLPGFRMTPWPREFSKVDPADPDTRAKHRSTVVGDPGHEDFTPDTVVGLSMWGSMDEIFLLDVKIHVIYWRGCSEEFKFVEGDRSKGLRGIRDDAYAWAPEKEAEWREDSAVWAIPEFLEEMKNCYRKLEFLPLSDWYVAFGIWPPPDATARIREVYRKHGWPDLELYNKKACMEELNMIMEEVEPGYASRQH